MTINGNPIIDPQGLIERPIYIQTDNISLNGGFQRNRLNTKKSAILRWTGLYPNEYADIIAWAGAGVAVDYSNPQSRYGTYSFTGIPTIENDGEYMQGGSYLTDTLVVSIREV